MSRLYVFLLIPVLSDLGSAIQFYQPVNSAKCLQEDIHRNVLVTGEYEVSEQAETTTLLKIVDSSGYMLYAKENATKGMFSFTTENENKFEVCFYSRSPMGSGKVPDQLVHLILKHGVEARNHKETENVENLTPFEAKLIHIEHLSQSVADGFGHLKKREKEMQYLNASTSTRVLFLSIISMSCLSALALWQVFYLRRMFKAKKLIE